MPYSAEEIEEMQTQMVQSMEDFKAQNPAIAEALDVMNMTMPDYFLAMDAIRGSQIISTSAYTEVPIQGNA